MKKAFTMMELVFVIVIIGILSAIAIPKLAATRDDAIITKARTTLSAVRNSIASERQKRILRGVHTDIAKLNGNGGAFSTFDDANGHQVLEYDLKSCQKKGCWTTSDGVTYTYKGVNGDCTFKLENNRFVDKTNGGCSELE